jgi:glucose-1-phosphate cytidylyltransferase
VILAGGLGTRISEESNVKPKPMIEIGGMPVLWHIMKIYSSYEINDFVICLGYKGHAIKEYFANYFLKMSDVTIDVKNNKMEIHKNVSDAWKITLVDTGLETMTGGRLKQVKKYVENETFCLSYGDDLKKINIRELIAFHRNKKTKATMTVFQQQSRFGMINVIGDKVSDVKEKSIDSIWLNGGYFVMEPEIFDYIKDDSTILEREPLERLSQEGNLSAYKYTDLYYPMDTLNDKNNLQELWNNGKAYWKTW